MPRLARLDRDVHVDVAIVGGGITGITAAYLLKAAGRTVALLERHRMAGIDTGHTTAHLTAVTDKRLSALVDEFGRDHARAVWDAGFAAIAQIDDLVRTENINCHFEWVPATCMSPRVNLAQTGSTRKPTTCARNHSWPRPSALMRSTSIACRSLMRPAYEHRLRQT
jgi:glycine/D-amino acid oxidase-like deaminating enzyme